MKKIKLHPVFLIMILAFILLGKWLIVLSSLIAVLLHEGAHFLVARLLGYRLSRLTLMPYGAVLYSDDQLLSMDEAYISIAGPAANFLIAAVIMAMWWLFPETYSYTYIFCHANVAIGTFNLLPIYPLDGSKLLLSLSKNRQKTLKVVKILGIVFSILFALGFIVTAFYEINFSFGIISILLFAGSFTSDNKERYIHLCNQLSYLKDFSQPIEKKKIIVNNDITLSKLLRSIKPHALYEIEVVDKCFNTIAVIKEKQLENMLYNNSRNDKIGDILAR
ncbi:MAG: site-2 protease family protein [Bacillota bacterium]